MTGSELMQQFIPNSPFPADLGIRLEEIEPDRATLVLPWAERLATIGDVVHGGAIATLADCAVMAAAWSGAEVDGNLRGVTVSITLDFLDTARAEDLVAHARVVRRGRSLCFCEVDVEGAGARLLAKGLATYKVG
jgi:uncharacterized protein (TIGR00369 family)